MRLVTQPLETRVSSCERVENCKLEQLHGSNMHVATTISKQRHKMKDVIIVVMFDTSSEFLSSSNNDFIS